MSIGLGHLELRSGLEHFFGAVLDAPQYMGKDAGELESDRNYSEHKVNTKWRYSNDIVNVWGSLWYCLIIVPLTSLTECHQESLVHDRVPPKKTRVWKGLDQALHFEWSRLLTIIWFMVCCEDIVVHPTYVCQKQWTVDESRSHCFFFPRIRRSVFFQPMKNRWLPEIAAAAVIVQPPSRSELRKFKSFSIQSTDLFQFCKIETLQFSLQNKRRAEQNAYGMVLVQDPQEMYRLNSWTPL